MQYSIKDDFHALSVISALATVVRDVKIIFVNAKFGKYDPGFLVEKDTKPWDWLIKNAIRYDIDIVSMSFSFKKVDAAIEDKINKLAANEVFMLSSLGNTYEGSNGSNTGHEFPQNHPRVYAVGSVDHEYRGK